MPRHLRGRGSVASETPEPLRLPHGTVTGNPGASRLSSPDPGGAVCGAMDALFARIRAATELTAVDLHRRLPGGCHLRQGEHKDAFFGFQAETERPHRYSHRRQKLLR